MGSSLNSDSYKGAVLYWGSKRGPNLENYPYRGLTNYLYYFGGSLFIVIV